MGILWESYGKFLWESYGNPMGNSMGPIETHVPLSLLKPIETNRPMGFYGFPMGFGSMGISTWDAQKSLLMVETNEFLESALLSFKSSFLMITGYLLSHL